MNSAMKKTRAPKTLLRLPHLLLVGGSKQDFIHLRELLMDGTRQPAHFEHLVSPAELLSQNGKGRYDLLLCSSDATDDDAFQLLRTVRQHHSRVPLIFLSDPVSKEAIEVGMQSAVTQPGAAEVKSDSEPTLRKLWRLVEQSTDSVIIMNRSGVMEYVNPAFEALTGYSRREAIGQTLGILKSEQQAGELYEEMWNTVLAGNVFRGIVMDRKKNGETLIIEKALTPLRDATGEITHFISTGRDITERRQLESDLRQAQKMDAIGRLAGGVAHDFNNLLLVISAYAELMLDSLAEDDPLRRNVGEIITASRRAADLTRQLLAFGRKQVQLLQVLDLNTVIAEIKIMLPRLIGEDIELIFLPEQNLGKVKADPVQIEQIVMNLAANARDAMPSGGTLTIETATVEVDAAYVQRHSIVPAGSYVLLTVADSGQGIATKDLPHIFEPFFTTKGEGKGTGLGLATVYGIVKQNGGFIWVYSEPAQGTTFKIYLPQVQSLRSEACVTKPAAQSPRGCETVLLVEDEASVRQAERQFLMQSGYNVLEAFDGEDALREAREHDGPIHLMITDVVMPRISGPALAAKLVDNRPDMKVLFVSGYAEKTVLQHGNINVTQRFLQKPFSLNTLGKKVREVLETSSEHVLAGAD
jgi:two-component system, cell cycle sensor histidine kinase and response regulator CckA